MKEKSAFIGTIVLLLIVVILSGCEEIGNKFEGTWTGDLKASVTENITELTFTEDKVYVTFHDTLFTSIYTTVGGTYKTEGNTLILDFPTGKALTYKYEFKDGYLYLDGSKFTKTG